MDRHHQHSHHALSVLAGLWTVELLPAEQYEVRYVAEQHSIGLALDPQMGTHAIGTDRRRRFHARVGAVGIIQAGCDVYSTSDFGGEYLRVLARDERNLHLPEQLPEEFTGVETARSLRRALLLSASPFEVEQLVLKLIVCLGDIGTNKIKKDSGWMTPHRLRLVEELIEERLEHGVLVSDLARHLGLSTPFFSRAYRDATGRSPQEHIIQRRVHRARSMLRTSGMSLAHIAAQCGFSSQAHMSTLFRTRLGIRPSELLRMRDSSSGTAKSATKIDAQHSHKENGAPQILQR